MVRMKSTSFFFFHESINLVWIMYTWNHFLTWIMWFFHRFFYYFAEMVSWFFHCCRYHHFRVHKIKLKIESELLWLLLSHVFFWQWISRILHSNNIHNSLFQHRTFPPKFPTNTKKKIFTSQCHSILTRSCTNRYDWISCELFTLQFNLSGEIVIASSFSAYFIVPTLFEVFYWILLVYDKL